MLQRLSHSITLPRRMLSFKQLLNYKAINEPILEFKKSSPERAELQKSLEKFSSLTTHVPIVIGDEEIYSGEEKLQPCPYDHQRKVAKFHHASQDVLSRAIEQSLSARRDWEARPFEERASVLLKAADLCAGKYRTDMVAATMIGQGKNIFQAEIDATCEFIDFLRFNVSYLGQLLLYQPISTSVSTNKMYYRGTEGFWAAIAPFNFTAIAGNLSTAPTLMGNVLLFKPSDTAVLSSYIMYKILREAGMPPNVIQFVPADGPTFGSTITQSPHLAGINFTGSVPTFHTLWKDVGKNVGIYRTLPRMVGELGGKNFHFIHPSADVQSVVNGTIRSAYEYSGQKCSACSRMYVPHSLWSQIKEGLLVELAKVKVGAADAVDSFLSAVIDERSFNRISSYLDFAKSDSNCKVLFGGKADKSKGYFVQPTLIETRDPKSKLMVEEIFGPVCTVYVYEDAKLDETVRLVDTSTKYALTGAIFCRDESALAKLKVALRDSVGNMYINDKSTGAVVAQQPFGGARASGTNDKAGGPHYLLRFASPLSVKETTAPLTGWTYDYMSE